MTRVAVIGVGRMGAPMARRLIGAGHAVTVYDRAREPVDELGGAGAGQATKLTNNILAGTHMAVLAEAVALAGSEGLDLADVYEIVSNGTGDSRVLRNRYPVPGVVPDAPASNRWAPLFPVELIAK